MPRVLNSKKRSESWAEHMVSMHLLEQSYRIDRHLRNICRFIWLLCIGIMFWMTHEIGQEGTVDGTQVFALFSYGVVAWVMRKMDKFYTRTMNRRF